MSATSNETNNTQFASRLSQSNLTSLLDKTPSITVFIPSDAAFAAFAAAAGNNQTQTPSQISSQLLAHLLVDQVLYLPLLVDGATYQTKAGTSITITVRGGRYFVNGVLIVQSNFILENGVAHILNNVRAHPPYPYLPILSLFFFLFVSKDSLRKKKKKFILKLFHFSKLGSSPRTRYSYPKNHNRQQ